MPTSITADPRYWNSLQRIITLRLNQDSDILLPNANLFFVAAVVYVGHGALHGHVTS